MIESNTVVRTIVSDDCVKNGIIDNLSALEYLVKINIFEEPSCVSLLASITGRFPKVRFQKVLVRSLDNKFSGIMCMTRGNSKAEFVPDFCTSKLWDCYRPDGYYYDFKDRLDVYHAFINSWSSGNDRKFATSIWNKYLSNEPMIFNKPKDAKLTFNKAVPYKVFKWW